VGVRRSPCNRRNGDERRVDLPHTVNLAFARQIFSLLFSTRDKQEGVEAFLEMRKPQWKAC
jgi:hypothetical protein